MLTFKIYVIKLIQWLFQPLLKWKAREMGLPSIIATFCAITRKASTPGTFIHDNNDLYVIYDLFCGIHVRLKHQNALFLSSLPNESRRKLYSTSGCFEAQCIQTHEISIFYNFFKNINLSEYHFFDHWIIYYKDKQIDYITCTLNLSDARNPWSNRHFTRLFTFDCNFNLINIRKDKYCLSAISNTVCIQDELLLISLTVSKPDSELGLLFPEFYTPSAYDFNSDEFACRLKLADIL